MLSKDEFGGELMVAVASDCVGGKLRDLLTCMRATRPGDGGGPRGAEGACGGCNGTGVSRSQQGGGSKEGGGRRRRRRRGGGQTVSGSPDLIGEMSVVSVAADCRFCQARW